MATALDVQFARRYYRWFWRGTLDGMLRAESRLRFKATEPVYRVRYRAAMRAIYAEATLDGAVWDDDIGKTFCEVCLKSNVNTLLVKVDGKGLISGDPPGDLLCAKCHPEAATRIAMLQLGELVTVE